MAQSVHPIEVDETSASAQPESMSLVTVLCCHWLALLFIFHSPSGALRFKVVSLSEYAVGHCVGQGLLLGLGWSFKFAHDQPALHS